VSRLRSPVPIGEKVKGIPVAAHNPYVCHECDRFDPEGGGVAAHHRQVVLPGAPGSGALERWGASMIATAPGPVPVFDVRLEGWRRLVALYRWEDGTSLRFPDLLARAPVHEPTCDCLACEGRLGQGPTGVTR